MAAIPVERTRTTRHRPADAELGFGRHFTDHLFRADWLEGRGWHGARVEPYGPVALDPAASSLHYGQSIFEGLKVFRRPGGLALFRPRLHAERFAASARRLVMPPVDPDLLLDGIRALVRTDASWMPAAPGTALYVRPVMFATEPFLGVRPAKAYALLVLLSPVGGYFAGPPRPLRIWVERSRARAARGGLGAAKASANYVASLLAAEEAKARGFDQVLWLDAAERRWLEEIGTMNVFARIGGTLVTPPLEGTILAGVTRDSVLQLCRDRGLPVEERRVSLDELVSAHRDGRLEEVFGTGTASLVAPIGEIAWEGTTLTLPAPGAGAIGEPLRTELGAIQRGEAPDRHGWLEELPAP
jgi:branched-chain amino acid aminotransferase